MFDVAWALIIMAAALNGILAGASLDQSIKQLPARLRIGALAYSRYSRAADLGNGIAWYAVLGISGAVTAVLATVATLWQGAGTANNLPLYAAAVLSIAHSLVTAQAAPTNFSQRRHENDEAALTLVFDRFARLQALRAVLQLLTFAALLWAVASYGR